MMQNNYKLGLMGLFGLILGAGVMFAIMRYGHFSSPHHHSKDTSVAASAEIWTCAMHPHIRQNEPGDCPICGMALTVASKNESNDPLVLQMTKTAVQLANIQTSIVSRENGTKRQGELRLSGKIRADERLASSQVAQVGGRIEKLYATFTGEQVKAGQKLAEIYAPDFIVAQRELLEAKKLESTNPALLEAARTKLRYWKIAPETIAAVEKSGQIQETVSLYANESGVISRRRVAVGDYVRQGESLFDLMGLHRVWGLFDAYEEDLQQLNLGMEVNFTTGALPGQVFSAPITFIDPVIDPQTRVASLRVEINNPGKRLKPEMLVTGTVALNQPAGGMVVVPKSAVLWTGPRSVVYVEVPDRTIPSFQFREVHLGEAVGDHYQILSGLEEGEKVVTHGSFVIDAAAQLNNQASMINQNVELKQNAQEEMAPDFTTIVGADFQNQLEGVVKTYLDLKDALIDTEAKLAVERANLLYQVVFQLESQTLPGQAQIYWQEQRSILEEQSRKIGKTTDVEKQRTQFDVLSQALIKIVKAFGIGQQTYYIQYCPMALDNQGATWLSAEDQVLNPYFGEVMLRCGIVKETIGDL